MNINLIGPVNSLSYGIVTSNILHSLTLRGHKVALFPINPHNMEAEAYLHESIGFSLKNAQMPDWMAPSIKIWHQHDMTGFVGNKKHIGFPIFELDRFNEIEKHHLKYPDELFVCSEWARQIVAKELEGVLDSWGINRAWETYIHVIPLGVNADIFFPPKRPLQRKTTVFLNAGKWEFRKGHDILDNLFCEAFNETDDVELWMMPSNPVNKEECVAAWENHYKSCKLGNKIKILPRVESQSQVADIMRAADCGIFPSRAEGWNLEALEMLACGKQIIVTDYSAHTEFCDELNSCLIRIDETETARDGVWFHGQGNWAKIGEKQKARMIEHMQNVHKAKQRDDYISGQGYLGIDELLYNREGVKTAQHFSWDNTAKCIEEALNV